MATLYADINHAVLRNVPAGTTVLDIGCGTGILGAELKKKGCTVYGIEYEPAAAAIARKRLDRVIIADIEREPPRVDQRFDVLIFADVLEHLRNPGDVLKRFLRFLKPSGIAIISLPNIANWTVRSRLLTGNFSRTETGILDKTHLHFYTLATARQMLSHAGLRIEKIDVTPNFIRSPFKAIQDLCGKRHDHKRYERLFTSTPYKLYAKTVLPLETFIARLWKRGFAYQFVFVAEKA
jgi:methionine biosynthesis protein MetW